MSKWICIKDNEVINTVEAEESYMQTSPEIAALYDSYMLADDTGFADIRIGSYLDNGVWKNPKATLSVNFNGQDLTDIDFTDTDFTGSTFVGATITGCKFSGCEGSFSLVGAIWNGQTIQHGPVWIENPYYYCMVTDVFTVMSCQVIPTNYVASMTDAEVTAADIGNPGKPQAFWAHIQSEFMALLASWA